MENFSRQPLEQRKIYFEETSARRGLTPQIVEKDFWVCWTLRQLFTVSPFGAYLTFKGGTSLSKVFNIIERFSEDIDLILDRNYLGFEGENDPEKIPSKGKRKDKVESLRQACEKKVAEEITPWLSQLLKEKISISEQWNLKLVMDDGNVQSLLFSYPTCWPKEQVGYVTRDVKLQIGGRSDFWPSEEHTISSFVAEEFPEAFKIAHCSLKVLSPLRTFWEKATLLHEEIFRPLEKPIKGGMSRHYYDLYCLISLGVADKAAADLSLFERVVEHRKIYFPYSWVNYSNMVKGQLQLVPHAERMEEWMKDYKDMREMFFKDPLPFNDILQTVGKFAEKFNRN